MLNLSQISDETSLKKLFIDSMNALSDQLQFRFIEEPYDTDGELLEVKTSKNRFGFVRMQEACSGLIDAPTKAVIRNSVRMLALFLEKQLQEKMLADEKLLLNDLVARQTKKLEAANRDIKESEQQLKAILEANPDPMVVYDTHGHPQFVNLAFTETFGWILDELKGKTIPFVPDNQKEITTKAIEEIYRFGKPVQIQTQRLTKDGKNIDVIISAANIEKSLEVAAGMVVNIFDITEQKKLQTQLHQAQKMESVGRLAGGVAHDFNNMLGVILGHVEFALEETEKTDNLYFDLKEIHKAAQRSADLTKQLLTFARKQTISPRQLDLNDTVESMLNMLRRLIGEDIDLVWQPAAHLWPVKMDPSQIDQILANLCVNARDAISGVGKLTIETGIKSFDEEYCKQHAGFAPGDFVLLAVSDNGCGMDKETLDNLFEPFFTTKEVGKGTGLGLATVYGIVKQNNGFINVYSEPGQGSTFKIYLPRLIVDEDTDNAVPDKKAVAGGTETILLVEDEPSILRMTRMML
ncbi:MAG: PAS domain S-box protein, partial [Desulfotignum sp.]|nr:PAS domain S-box protein [Desulfotignum sp.]